MEINVKEAFTFMFKDKDFKKKYFIGTLFGLSISLPLWFLMVKANSLANMETFDAAVFVELMLGYLLLFIGSFITFFNMGYLINYAKSKIATGSNELPDWNGNYGKSFVNGIKMWAGMMLFTMAFGMLFYIALIILFLILMLITGVIGAALGLTFESNAFGGLVIIMLIIGILIFIPIYMLFIMFIEMAISSFLVDANILSFFNFKRIKAISKDNLFNLFVVTLIIFFISIICGVFLLFSPTVYCILLTAVQFYLLLVTYNLYAQYTQIGMKKYLARVEAEKQIYGTDTNK